MPSSPSDPEPSAPAGESVTRGHRGPHPEDVELFAPAWHGPLRGATADLSWLLSRGYAANASLKLTGDRYQLRGRQRMAVMRAACADGDRLRRAATCLPPEALRGQVLQVDAFNLLIAVEAALSGGILLRGQDGCWRDLSSVHGSYRAVRETDGALRLIGNCLAGLGPRRVCWLLDQPVSNSGRLAARLREVAAVHGWPWDARLVMSPDAELKITADPVVTTDSIILDSAGAWVNLNALWLRDVPGAWRVDLGKAEGG